MNKKIMVIISHCFLFGSTHLAASNLFQSLLNNTRFQSTRLELLSNEPKFATIIGREIGVLDHCRQKQKTQLYRILKKNNLSPYTPIDTLLKYLNRGKGSVNFKVARAISYLAYEAKHLPKNNNIKPRERDIEEETIREEYVKSTLINYKIYNEEYGFKVLKVPNHLLSTLEAFTQDIKQQPNKINIGLCNVYTNEIIEILTTGLIEFDHAFLNDEEDITEGWTSGYTEQIDMQDLDIETLRRNNRFDNQVKKAGMYTIIMISVLSVLGLVTSTPKLAGKLITNSSSTVKKQEVSNNEGHSVVATNMMSDYQKVYRI